MRVRFAMNMAWGVLPAVFVIGSTASDARSQESSRRSLFDDQHGPYVEWLHSRVGSPALRTGESGEIGLDDSAWTNGFAAGYMASWRVFGLSLGASYRSAAFRTFQVAGSAGSAPTTYGAPTASYLFVDMGWHISAKLIDLYVLWGFGSQTSSFDVDSVRKSTHRFSFSPGVGLRLNPLPFLLIPFDPSPRTFEWAFAIMPYVAGEWRFIGSDTVSCPKGDLYYLGGGCVGGQSRMTSIPSINVGLAIDVAELAYLMKSP